MTKPLVWLLTLSAAPGLAAVAALNLAATNGPLFTQFEQMLQDKDLDVRLAVVEGLQDIRTKAAIAALHTAISDSTPEVSFAAAKALWALNDPAGKQALLAVLEGDNKTASGFFSKEKRQAIRMMHTPRTTILYAVRQGVGFAPVPGLGPGDLVASLTVGGVCQRSRKPGARQSQQWFHAWRRAPRCRSDSTRAPWLV